MPLSKMNLGLYLLASLIFFVDFVDLLVRLYLRRQNTGGSAQRSSPATSVLLEIGTFSPYQMRTHLRPFVAVASVHDASAYIDQFLTSMQRFRDQLWIIDDASTDDTAARVEAAGVRVIRSLVNRRKPAALQALLRHIPAHVDTI